MTLFWIGGFYFFYFAFIGINVVFFPKLLFDIGYSPLQIGILFSVLPLVRFLTPFVFSKYISFTTSVFRYSLSLTFASTLALSYFLESFWLLFTSLVFWSVAFSVILPFVDAKALTIMNKDKYSKVRVAGSVGFVATTLLVGLISNSELFQISLLIGTSFFILVSGWLLIDENDRHTDNEISSPQTINLWKHKSFWIAMFLMQIAFGAYYNFFTIFASNHGFSSSDISFFWTLGVACEIIMLVFQGSLFRFSLNSLIIVATLLTSLRWLLIDLFPSHMTIIYIAQSLHSVGFALYHTATIALLFELYPHKRVAQQYYYGISFGLGGFLGALVFGKIYGEDIFLIASILTLISGAVMMGHKKEEV